jgi:hypothetical protein
LLSRPLGTFVVARDWLVVIAIVTVNTFGTGTQASIEAFSMLAYVRRRACDPGTGAACRGRDETVIVGKDRDHDRRPVVIDRDKQ